MSDRKCVYCGGVISPSIAKHSDRCKDCDRLSPKDRVELGIRNRQATFLELIASELKRIRIEIVGGDKSDEPEAETEKQG